MFHRAFSAAPKKRVKECSVSEDVARSGPFLSIGGLAVAFFLYAWSAIALPSWLNSLVLPVFWLVLVVVAARWFTRRPRASVRLPVGAVVVWFAVVLLVPRGGRRAARRAVPCPALAGVSMVEPGGCDP